MLQIIQNSLIYSGKGTVLGNSCPNGYQKAPFLLLHHSYMKTWIKLEATYKPPQGYHLFGKGSFVTFDLANLEAIGNKHGVSDTVFKVTRIIE